MLINSLLYDQNCRNMNYCYVLGKYINTSTLFHSHNFSHKVKNPHYHTSIQGNYKCNNLHDNSIKSDIHTIMVEPRGFIGQI